MASCPKCGTSLKPPGHSGGRPKRWCSEGCRRSGESEMRILHCEMKNLQRRRSDYLLRSQYLDPSKQVEKVDALIADLRAKYDQLAGCGGAL
jgi:hypothetical protein